MMDQDHQKIQKQTQEEEVTMRKKSGRKRRVFALLLALAMLGTSLDLSAWTVQAAPSDTEDPAGNGQEELQWYVEYDSPVEVWCEAQQLLGAAETAEGNHAKYIERVNVSAEAKALYDTLENNPNVLKDPCADMSASVGKSTSSDGDTYYYCTTSIPATGATYTEKMAEVRTVYAAFLRDHPEVFWLTGGISVGCSYVGDNYTVYLYLHTEKADGTVWDVRDLYTYPDESDKEGTSSVEKINEACRALEGAVASICDTMDQEIGADAADFEQVAYFNQWLTKNNCYNSEAANLLTDQTDNTARNEYLLAWQCLSALSEGMTGYEVNTTAPVCEGYAKAFQVLCAAKNIPCVLVSGTGVTSKGSGPHMWNSVQVNDTWYGVDVTWNDPMVDGTSDLESTYENTKYLLVGSNTSIDDKTFANSHVVNNTVYIGETDFNNGPTLSTDGYEMPPFRRISITKNEEECTESKYTMKYGTTGDGALTFTAAAIDYSGNKTEEGVTYCWKEGEKVLSQTTEFTVPSNASAGDHTYTVTVEKTVDGTPRSMSRSINVSIEQADPVTENILDKTAYVGQTLGEFSLPSGGTGYTPGSWKWEEGDTAPVGAVGSNIHTAVFTPSDTTNYKSKTVDVTFMVSKATVTVKLLNTYPLERAYNGEAYKNPTKDELKLTNVTYEELQFTWYKRGEDGGTFTKLSGPPSETGSYKLEVTVNGTDIHESYSDDDLAYVDIKSEKAEITVDSLNSSFYYGADSFLQPWFTNNVDAPMTYTVLDDSNAVTVDENGMVTIKEAASSVRIRATVAAKPGAYEQALQGTVTISVAPRSVHLQPQDAEAVKGGPAPKFSYTYPCPDDILPGDRGSFDATKLSIYYSVYSADKKVLYTTQTSETGNYDFATLVSGEYKVRGVVENSPTAANTNYSAGFGDLEGTLRIYEKKASLTWTGSEPTTSTFDNQEITIDESMIEKTNCKDAKVTYSYYLLPDNAPVTFDDTTGEPTVNEKNIADSYYKAGLPKNAGSYLIRFAVDADNEYYTHNSAVGYCQWTIKPAEIKEGSVECEVTLPNITYVYNGQDHSLGSPTVELKFYKDGSNEPYSTYTVPSSEYSIISDGQWKEAGDYIAVIQLKGNCTGQVEKSYTVLPAEGVNPPISPMTVEYNKKNKTVGDVELSGDWSWSADTAGTALKVGESVTGVAVYKGDAQNYKTVNVAITMSPCTHNFPQISVVEQEPDCENSGWQHKECSICGETTVEHEILSPLGHTGGTATCISEAVCSRCHQTYGTTNPANHVHTETINAKAANCTEAGYTGDIKCTDCLNVVTQGAVISPLGHTGGTATCCAKAVCDRCHQAYGAINPANHVHTEIINAKAATCTESGYTGDTKCTDCQKVFTQGTVIPASGHTGGAVTGAKVATCTEAGYTGDTKCTKCGVVIARGSVIPATGHSYTSTVTKEPTTAAEGQRTYTCSRCGHSYVESIEKLPKEMGLTDGTWKQDGGQWWYQSPDGSYPSNGWSLIEGEWYVFDESGYMETGWYQSGNTWYYLNSSGVMQTGWLGDGGTWYYMKADGSMATGWVKDGSSWYYMSAGGVMQTGWKQIGGVWYYFSGSGVMATGWQKVGGTWYYFSDGGAMQTEWQKIGDTWYYFKPSGAMSTGWEKVGTTWYYFAGSGAMVTGWNFIDGGWYYFAGSGAMVTGWNIIDGDWYYFYGSGTMAADTTIGGYRLSSGGKMY